MSVTTFQLHRSSMVLIGLLAVVVCGLWFTAGLSVGIAWQIVGLDETDTPSTVEPAYPDAPAPTRRLGDSSSSTEAAAVTVAQATASDTLRRQTPLRRPTSLSRPTPPRRPAIDPPVVQVDAGGRATASAARAAPLPAELRGTPSQTADAVTPAPPAPAQAQAPSPPPPSAPEAASSVASTTQGSPPSTAQASAAAPTAAPAPTAGQGASAATSSGFAVQLGAFLHDENTQDLVQDLQKRGLAPFVVRTPTAQQQILQSVRIGPYSSKREALDTVERLRSRQGLDSFIVRVDPRID